MKPQRRPKKLLWNCQMTGHKPMASNSGDENMIYRLDGKRHVGRICASCKCPYFEVLLDTDGLLVKL